MFSEIPKLFDRNFAIGYFFPVAAFLAASLVVTRVFGVDAMFQAAVSFDLLIGTTLIVLVAWFGGVGLLVINWEIVRLFEGYGRLNPLRLFGSLERHRFTELNKNVKRVEDKWSALVDAGKEIPTELMDRYMNLMREKAEQFPDDALWLMPTTLGNVIRAFEVYPRVMYGIDAIPGWYRLLAVIPKDYQNVIDSSKAQMDFWVNLGLLGWLLVLEYFGIVILKSDFSHYWIPIIAFTVAGTASRRSIRSAITWGQSVKAAFDLYLPDLRARLGFPLAEAEDEKKNWVAFSQAILYRDPGSMPPRRNAKTSTDPEEDS